MLKLNRRRKVVILVLILALAATAGAGYFVYRHNHATPNPGQNIQSHDVEENRGGQILTVDTKQITIRESDGHITDLPLNNSVVFYDKIGKSTLFSSFKVGDWIATQGIAHYEDFTKHPISFTPQLIQESYPPDQLPPGWNY